MHAILHLPIILVIPFWVSACNPADTNTDATDAAGNTDKTHADLKSAALSYRKMPQASPVATWSPFDCVASPPVGATLSRSKDDDTHGRKLYYLYVKDYEHYVALGTNGELSAKSEPPIGQMIFKETWWPVEVDGSHSVTPLRQRETVASHIANANELRIPPAAENEGAFFQPGEKGPLFAMQYLGRDAPDTDRGWIYATFTPNGRKITAVGRIESCVNCHHSAPHGRLFGLARPLRSPESFEPN